MAAEVVFGLENAGWPALLVDGTGVIRRSNQAAAKAFSASLVDGATRLSAVWSAQNEQSADQFIARHVSTGAAQQIRFLFRNGDSSPCSTFISNFTADDRKYFVFQFFPEQAIPLAAPAAPASPVEAPAVSTTITASPAPAPLDAGVAHKQKLDCALQLTRTVALDFNNALTSILGHTSLILSQMEPAHHWRNSLMQVEKSAERAAEIAHDLAAFSRQDKDVKAQVAGNLNELLRRVVDLFRKPNTAVEWKLNLETKLYTVNFDEAKMQQAMMKVLENAMQATTENGRVLVLSRNRDVEQPETEGSITLAPGCYVCVEVSDNGPGMAPEVLPRIFEPFFTTKPGHRGLGLAWVYGIITNHGGSISVTSDSTVGGTSFRIFLPAQRRVVRDKNFGDSDLRGSETVMIVDDEDLLLTMGQMILTAFGYKVVTANSGEKALQILAGGKEVDLVITDMVMPSMSGRELVDRLRKVSPGIKIICSSGFIRSQTVGDDVDEAYLQKPFTSHELLSKVRQVLSHS